MRSTLTNAKQSRTTVETAAGGNHPPFCYRVDVTQGGTGADSCSPGAMAEQAQRRHVASQLDGRDAGAEEFEQAAQRPAHTERIAIVLQCHAWYDRFVARLSSEEIANVRSPDGWAAYAVVGLRGRRHVRNRLGLAPDAMDEIVPTAPFERPLSLDDIHDRLDNGRRTPNELRVLTFQRRERAEVRRRWPDEYTQTDVEYYPAAEGRWRELRDRGIPSIRIVAGVVDELVAFAERSGESPTDTELKSRYAESIAAERLMAWPPDRNSPCWCGSGAKYNKCCGRPGTGG